MRLFFTFFLLLISKSLIAQELESTLEFSSQIMNMAGSFVTIIVVLIVIVFLLKKFINAKMQTANQLNKIKILEKRALSQKSCLYLIEVDDTQILIGESQAGLHLVSQLPSLPKDSTDEKVDSKETTSFAKILNSKLKIPSLRTFK
jgi:flagellar biogenesis protein FliO